VKHGKQKSRRFTGAGLGAGYCITAFKNFRNHLLLYRGGFLKVHGLDALYNAFIKTECVKIQNKKFRVKLIEKSVAISQQTRKDRENFNGCKGVIVVGVVRVERVVIVVIVVIVVRVVMVERVVIVVTVVPARAVLSL
jgi:hypothetical protein